MIIVIVIIVGLGIFIGSLFLVKKIQRKNIDEIDILKEINKFNEIIIKKRNNYFAFSDRQEIQSEFEKVCRRINNKKISTKNKITFGEFIETVNNLEHNRKKWNKDYIERELIANEKLLSNIDGKSLDEQQRLAVITDEDSNLVIAGAGSGKTLTISAKVKYLVESKGINPEEILLISFSSKSAQEMYERISKKLNINTDVKTFHKMGLDIIKKAKEYRPDVAPEEFLNKVIKKYFKETITNDENVIHKFINFLTYYFNIPQDIEKFDNLGEYYNSYKHLNLETLKGKIQNIENEIEELKYEYKSIQGEKVKSLEEVNIANFLFLNGIEYIYEYKYPFEQEDKYRKQYRPDFYLPEYNIYIEHFGITKDNKAPWLSEIEEKKYLDGIEWKRKIHKQNNTKLIETYSYYSKDGSLLEKLEKNLKQELVEFHKVNFKEIYEKIYNQGDDSLTELIRLINTFINLYKSNGYDEEKFSELKSRASKFESKFSQRRIEMFIDIVKSIYVEYQKALCELDYIDFNDMINEANKIIKNKQISLKYKYIIIDEYQDISMSRFNLIKEIKNNTNAKLVCVGDDWQSIYRFAGSDINLFTNFGEFVGYYELVKIEKTYRNSQQLIDMASRFVTKNPNQIIKNLISDKRLIKPLKIMGYSGYVAINEIDSLIEEIVSENGQNTNITIIARNNKDILRLYDVGKNQINDEHSMGILKIKNIKKEINITCSKYPELNIKYMTVHKSKGLEGENVILINLENRMTGFPNKFVDDQLITLLLSTKEEYPYSEERRLFYVALTRTKNKAYLLTKIKEKSIFVEELMKDFNLELETLNRKDTILDNPNCPICIAGKMVLREDRSSEKMFLGCSNYPMCNSTLTSIEIIDNQIKCIECGSYMIRKKGPYGEFYGCYNFTSGCKNTLPINQVENNEDLECIFDVNIMKNEEQDKTIKLNCEEDKALSSIEICNVKDIICKEEKVREINIIAKKINNENKNNIKLKENSKIKEKVYLSNEVKGDKKKTDNIERLRFKKGDQVNHINLGNGEIVDVNKELIKVKFSIGLINFSYKTCIEDSILKKINKVTHKDKLKLMQLSDKLSLEKVYNKLALEVNLRLISNGIDDEKYYYRLAKCYKNRNKIDEAINVYRKILLVYPNSREAQKELEMYRDLKRLGKYQNPHEKVYHGHYGDGIYEGK